MNRGPTVGRGNLLRNKKLGASVGAPNLLDLGYLEDCNLELMAHDKKNSLAADLLS